MECCGVVRVLWGWVGCYGDGWGVVGLGGVLWGWVGCFEVGWVVEVWWGIEAGSLILL